MSQRSFLDGRSLWGDDRFWGGGGLDGRFDPGCLCYGFARLLRGSDLGARALRPGTGGEGARGSLVRGRGVVLHQLPEGQPFNRALVLERASAPKEAVIGLNFPCGMASSFNPRRRQLRKR